MNNRIYPMNYNTGEKPGKGKYVCTKCGEIINLPKDEDELPSCPNHKCNSTVWKKM